MKKILFTFFLLTFLCFPIVSNALATNSSYDNIKVYFFYNENCKDCDNSKEWLQEELKENNRVKVEYIKVDGNEELNTKVRKSLNIKKDNLPLMVIGSNYFIGFNNKLKEMLMKAIKSYEDADDYCDVVSKLRNNENVNDCLKLNKDIYNQSTGLPPFVIVIIVLGIAGLIIGIGLIIKKKKT